MRQCGFPFKKGETGSSGVGVREDAGKASRLKRYETTSSKVMGRAWEITRLHFAPYLDEDPRARYCKFLQERPVKYDNDSVMVVTFVINTTPLFCSVGTKPPCLPIRKYMYRRQ